jgi:hypothetical protein
VNNAGPDLTPKSIFNPLPNDFSTIYKDDENVDHVYTVPSMQVTTFPTYLANHVITQLTDALINDRNLGYVTPEERRKIEEEILV